mmetsp:Transcript_26100/g.48664  ORF Transcript_26100/g.48664 Transcript_26100/m.48664 type:complete len:167 (-) Transcript_26100:502-1002(-)
MLRIVNPTDLPISTINTEPPKRPMEIRRVPESLRRMLTTSRIKRENKEAKKSGFRLVYPRLLQIKPLRKKVGPPSTAASVRRGGSSTRAHAGQPEQKRRGLSRKSERKGSGGKGVHVVARKRSEIKGGSRRRYSLDGGCGVASTKTVGGTMKHRVTGRRASIEKVR